LVMLFREIIKAVSVLILIVCGVTALGVWSDDRPTDLVKQLRIGTIVGGIIGIGGLVWVYNPRDIAPDYLSRIAEPYFDRGGFCFLLDAFESDGQCYLEAHVQNRYGRPCRGQIAIRLKKPVMRGGRLMNPIVLAVDCPPAGFCVITAPIGVPAEIQGRSAIFEVGASVEYPDGRGRTLRFKDGLVIRSNTRFRNTFATTLTVLGAMGGVIVWSSPATVTLALPANVQSKVPRDTAARSEIIWQLDDPVLEHVA
jgi:hypothetical protein